MGVVFRDGYAVWMVLLIGWVVWTVIAECLWIGLTIHMNLK